MSRQAEAPNPSVNSLETAVLVAGYGRLPEGTSSNKLYGSIGVIVVVDPTTGRIEDIEATFVTALAGQFLRDLVRGRSLRSEAEDVLRAITHAYLGKSQRALLAAFRDLIKEYQNLFGAAEDDLPGG